MRVVVLGPVGAWQGDQPVDLGGPKPRTLLAALALHAGRAVPPERMIELIWSGHPPAAAIASLQTYVAKLRQGLDPTRASRTPSSVLVTSAAGYALQLADDALDAKEFSTAIERAHRLLPRSANTLPRPPAATGPGDLAELRTALFQALSMWRDVPYPELPDDDTAAAERARLQGLRLLAVEDLALVRIALGEETAVAGDLQAFIAEHPLQESLWALRILALYRAGQQSAALEAGRRIRVMLNDELGIDPGPILQQLEQAVLRQSTELDWTIAEHALAIAPTVSPPASTTPGPPAPGPPALGSSAPASATEPPLVGRRGELQSLHDLVEGARQSRPGTALIVGEAGIGKSRLLRELMTAKESPAIMTLTVSCAEDQGAPPLWPWAQLLATLDQLAPAAGSPDLSLIAHSPSEIFADDPESEQSRFGLWESITRRLTDAARLTPLLLIFDDLHWADPSSLALLRHVIDRLGHARMAVVLARRPVVDPGPALLALGESLARRHTVRIELTGLSPADTGDLVTVLTGRTADDMMARQLWERTAGNAFFVTELIRMTGGTLSPPGTGGDIPYAVSDVVLARLSKLPAPSSELLLTAAIIGRDFDALVLAAAAGRPVPDVGALLAPALATGLVVELDAARYQFTHALVRDALVSSLPPSGRANRHAAVADALHRGQTLDQPRAKSEAVRHWLAAGPLHAAKAWRAAAAAAADAVTLRAWEEAAALLAEAIAAAVLDPAASDHDRYELHLRRADACRWTGDHTGLNASLLQAVAAAGRSGDVAAAARAAVGAVEGAVWMPRPYGSVEAPVVNALRDALRDLPTADTELRTRVMLALASELYYADAPQERQALVEQGLAVARRIDDPHLLVWAMTAASQATWRPDTADDRYDFAREALAAAERTMTPEHLAIAHYLLAGTAQETGRIKQMWQQIRLGREVCEANHLVAPLVALGWLEAPWLALRGEFEQAWALVAVTAADMERTSMPQQAAAPAATALIVQMISGVIDPAAIAAMTAVAETSPLPMQQTLLWMMLLAGQRAEAQKLYATTVLEIPPDTWMSLSTNCQIAEIAAEFGDADLGAGVYRWLVPYAGRPAAAAASTAMGPVDTYLAMAAVAVGEIDLARRHATEAETLCVEWEIPLATRRITALRERFGL
ncbi:MAG: BTAD domain-containing putative transcriptional regulator [Nakamurella sp.]